MARAGFLKHAAVYALGDLLLMAAGFVLVPLYARWLSPAEFGTLEVLERAGEIAAICLLGRGLPLAALALYKQGRDDEERRRATTAALLLALGGVLAGAAVLALGAGAVTRTLQVDDSLLLWFAVLAALLECLIAVALAVNQARLESGYYVLTSVGQFLFRVVLCVALVVGLGWGVWGIVLASLLRCGVFGCALALREWQRGLVWPCGQTFRHILSFALPFIPTGICFFVLNSGDRFFLMRCEGQEAVGIYGIAYKVALLVGLFSMTPLYRVWSARMYDAATEPNAPQVFGTMVSRILGVYTGVGLLLCLFQDEVIGIFAGAAFARAAPVVAPLVLAYWFYAASVLFEAGLYVRRQTRWKPLIALFSTAAMLALYLILIPGHGAMGAALATLAGFVLHAVATWAVGQRVFRVRYEYGRTFGVLGLAIACWLLSRLLGPGAVGMATKTGLFGLWLIALTTTGLIRPEEVGFVKELGVGVAAWLRRRGLALRT